MAFINGCARIETGLSIGNAQTCRYFTLLGARGMASRSVFRLTNKTRLGVSEPWRGFYVALHMKFTESRCMLSGKLIHKFYVLQFRRDFIRVPANVNLVVRKLKRSSLKL